MTNLVACPMCKDESLLKIPPTHTGPVLRFEAGRAVEVPEEEIHRVRGENCWQGAAGARPAYRGSLCMMGGVFWPSAGRQYPDVYKPSFEPLRPADSLALVRHSPTGFAWGYAGSGPAQLALAILLDHTKDEELSLTYYQLFKESFVVHFGDTWQIDVATIDLFLQETNVYREEIAEGTE